MPSISLPPPSPSQSLVLRWPSAVDGPLKSKKFLACEIVTVSMLLTDAVCFCLWKSFVCVLCQSLERGCGALPERGSLMWLSCLESWQQLLRCQAWMNLNHNPCQMKYSLSFCVCVCVSLSLLPLSLPLSLPQFLSPSLTPSSLCRSLSLPPSFSPLHSVSPSLSLPLSPFLSLSLSLSLPPSSLRLSIMTLTAVCGRCVWVLCLCLSVSLRLSV